MPHWENFSVHATNSRMKNMSCEPAADGDFAIRRVACPHGGRDKYFATFVGQIEPGKRSAPVRQERPVPEISGCGHRLFILDLPLQVVAAVAGIIKIHILVICSAIASVDRVSGCITFPELNITAAHIDFLPMLVVVARVG